MQNVDHKLKFKSSKGQLPFIEINGEEVADSAAIIAKLGQHFGVDADSHLSKEQKNISHALMSMIENHLYWVHVYWRSKNPESMIKVVYYKKYLFLGAKSKFGTFYAKASKKISAMIMTKLILYFINRVTK